mmetsp:Transcript_89181/g.241912  ORF Transcript_89181/g.241912 Transcript_89181/m.241912 type:complete len:249 (-) Transcript_89181:45-791(-)
MLSTTTATTRPRGNAAAAPPSPSSASSSRSMRAGAQRRNVARSACEWMWRMSPSMTRSWPSTPSGRDRSASLSCCAWRLSSAVWWRSRALLCVSNGSAPLQIRRVESTRKSMPCTSSSTASVSTSCCPASSESLVECACRRANAMRSFALSSSLMLDLPWPTQTCPGVFSPVPSSPAVDSPSPSSSPSSAFMPYISSSARAKPSSAARRLAQRTPPARASARRALRIGKISVTTAPMRSPAEKCCRRA